MNFYDKTVLKLLKIPIFTIKQLKNILSNLYKKGDCKLFS